MPSLALDFSNGLPLLMGIVNITPDSFSGDGLLLSENYVQSAVNQGLQMIADGASILDIGGESTRPDAVPVSIEEEIRRVRPVIQALHQARPDIPLSIDTMKAEVAREAAKAGAIILNDISGKDQDPAMSELAAQEGLYLVLMHNDAKPQATRQKQIVGGEYLADEQAKTPQDILKELESMAAIAIQQGVAKDHLILDPGIGFGKSLDLNLALINQLDLFQPIGIPVLLGPSRKSFIGRVLDTPPDERLEGTAAAIAIGTLRGASILRVHDVKFMARLVRMTCAISKAKLS
ncbi:MAG: dihydropteroate synthase [Bdellovibrionales bacterium]